MTRRLKAPQRRARRAARRRREGQEPDFDLLAVAARSAGESGLPPRRWPSGDLAFLAAVLQAHNLPAPLIRRLSAAAASLPANALLVDRLGAALADQIRFAPLGDLLRRPALLLLGPPGAGKTTLAAKLAARLGEKRALLIGTDTERAGGIAQLEEYAGVLGLAVTAAADAEALQRITASAAGRSVLIDTTGAVPGDEATRDRLAALIAASGAAPLLVLPADSATDGAVAMAQFFAPLGVDTLLPTRIDLVQRLGGLFAAADAGRFALPAAGMTPHFAYGLRPLTSQFMARRMLAAVLQDQCARLPAA